MKDVQRCTEDEISAVLDNLDSAPVFREADLEFDATTQAEVDEIRDWLERRLNREYVDLEPSSVLRDVSWGEPGPSADDFDVSQGDPGPSSKLRDVSWGDPGPSADELDAGQSDHGPAARRSITLEVKRRTASQITCGLAGEPGELFMALCEARGINDPVSEAAYEALRTIRFAFPRPDVNDFYDVIATLDGMSEQ